MAGGVGGIDGGGIALEGVERGDGFLFRPVMLAEGAPQVMSGVSFEK